MFNKVKIPIIVIILLIVGIYLRFWNLGRPSLWVDEVNFVFAAKSISEIGQPTLPSGYVYTRAPIYTAVTGYFYRFLGINEASTRLPAALFGVLANLLVYWIAARIFNHRVGLWALFFVTFSPFEIGWSRTARMYTMLQFFTLMTIYGFIRAFENMDTVQDKIPKVRIKFRFNQWIKQFWKNYRGALFWILFSLVFVVVAFQKIHFLIIFALGGLFISLIFIAIGCWIGRGQFLNRYMIVVITVFILSGLVWILYPKLGRMTQFFLSYIPPWAEGGTNAQNPLNLYNFLIEPYRFPFGCFFILGSIQVFVRIRKNGIILFFCFLFPFLILSFIFTHRIPVYLYYVYPIFLILAAYAVDNLLNSERQNILNLFNRNQDRDRLLNKRFQQRYKSLLFYLFLMIFIFSPWFRISLKIPFQGDGVFNMAVTYNEWKEAISFVKSSAGSNDLIITSLPLMAQFYKLPADYTLNWSLLHQAKELDMKNEQDRWKDNYAGVECIEHFTKLKELVASHNRGWIILEKYHFEHEQYIPKEVRNGIESILGKPFQTKRNTILVYSWGERSKTQE